MPTLLIRQLKCKISKPLFQVKPIRLLSSAFQITYLIFCERFKFVTILEGLPDDCELCESVDWRVVPTEHRLTLMRRPRGCWLSASCSCTPPPPPHRCFFWQSNSFLKKAPRVLERSSGSQWHYSNRKSHRPLCSPALSATYLAVSVCRVTRGLLRRWLSF